MSTAASSIRNLLTLLTAVGTFVAVLFVPVGITNAQTGSLFISEYVEGSGTNEAIEIYNPTDTAVSLGASGYMLAFFMDGETGIGGGAMLVGTIPAHGTWVVTPTDASPALLAYADQTVGPAAYWFDGNDAVALLHNGVAVDVIGQIGFDPGSAWGSGDVTTRDHTLRRKSSVTEGDENGTDPFDPSVQWNGYPVDTFDGLGWFGTPAVNQPVTMTCPAAFSTTQGIAASAPVTATDPDGTVTAIGIASVAPADPGTFAITGLSPASGTGGTAPAALNVGGSTPAGTYDVTLSATNDDGTPQSASCGVAVTVNPVTPQTLDELVSSLVTDGGIPATKAHLLTDRLERITVAADAGRTADERAQLRAFVNQVNGLSPHWISADAAATLVAEAELLAGSL